MDLFKEILVEAICKHDIQISIPNLTSDCFKVIETESYKALNKIKTIIEDDSLSDFDCIEKIVCIFEDMGSNAGNRHDFL